MGASQLIGTAVSAGGLGIPFNATNPYLKLTTSKFGVATFGLAHIQSYIPLAASKETRVNYCQKWFVHRTLRPEAYGGLVHPRLAKRVDYPVHEDVRTEATRHIVNRQSLRHAKPGLHIVDIAREDLIDQDALREALESGVVGAAGGGAAIAAVAGSALLSTDSGAARTAAPSTKLLTQRVRSCRRSSRL